MRIDFAEDFRLPAHEIFACFRTPADWVELFGFAGRVTRRGDGWYAVPLKNFPFPLVAQVTAAEESRLVHWRFRGFWRGEGEVRLAERDGMTRVEGYEEIAARWLPGLSGVLERLFMEREFRRIWELGWRRLRQREGVT